MAGSRVHKLDEHSVETPCVPEHLKHGVAPEGLMGTTCGASLYIVATPIGNLQDMSARALAALREVDTILAEDTRVSKKLLNHFGIQAKLERCDEHVIAQKCPVLIDRLRSGERMAYVSDAGTPGLSDPGILLVDYALDQGIQTQVIPGPSAALTALVASGLAMDSFFFAGFAPRKSGQRKKLFSYLGALPATFVLYESPYRVQQTVSDLAELFPQRRAAFCRELTKVHEEVVRMTLSELASEIAYRAGQAPQTLRGEFVIVVEGLTSITLLEAAESFCKGSSMNARTFQYADQGDGEILGRDQYIEQRLKEGSKKRSLAKDVACMYHLSSSEAYDHVVRVARNGQGAHEM